MHSPDLAQDSIAKIRDLFPDCVTEAADQAGNVRLAVDFDQLRQLLSDHIVEGPQERYRLDWPGKREALLTANAPITKTLRPCREESVDFDTTQNLFIEGDNLDVLKLLQEGYLGKVKLIYIDPPYNTGKDFIYQDKYAIDRRAYLEASEQTDGEKSLVANKESSGRFHSDWLSMMLSRLIVARRLLADDGIIVISIDENEHANLGKICDEVFGSTNYSGDIVWKNSSRNDQDYISVQHEYMRIYVKEKSYNKGKWIEKKPGLDEIYKAFADFKAEFGTDWKAIHKAALAWFGSFPASSPVMASKHYSWMDERGVYFPDNISGPNDGQYVYEVRHPNGKLVKRPSRGWFCPKEKMDRLIQEKMIHFGDDETTVPCLKTYLKNTEYSSLTSMRFVDGRAASNRLRTLFGEKIFTNPKDELLLSDIFRAMQVSGEDIVLDFFAGSGSSAHAVLELNKTSGSNCRFIAVQIAEDLNKTLASATGAAKKITSNAIKFLERRGLPATVAEICKERIRRTGAALSASNTHPDWRRDVGFRSLKVDSSNMVEVFYRPEETDQHKLLDLVNNVKPDRSDSEDLLFQVLIDWGVELTLSITREALHGKTIYCVDDNALIACFDADVTDALIKDVAARAPLRAVFRDTSFARDADRINAEQLFRQLSPGTEVRAI